VHAALVRERAGADERLAGPEVHVRRLVDVARHFGQMLETLRAQNLTAALQREVGDYADQIDVAAALADAVYRPLPLRRARPLAPVRAGPPPPPAFAPPPRRNRCDNGCQDHHSPAAAPRRRRRPRPPAASRRWCRTG